jgi:hypothetical protein
MEARLRELDGNLPTVKASRAVLQERIADERKAFELAQSMELSATQSDIRLCYATTKGGKHFAQALEDKGLILAHVTRHEAECSETINRLFLRDETKAFAPPMLKEGELVAVNALGNVYRFNTRTTGDERGQMEARLGQVDRRELMTLSEAKEVLRDVQRQRAGEAGLRRVRRANERLAAAYPVPHPRPSWEAQPQKQRPAHDDRLRPEFPADRMQREARKRIERNAEREGERWQEKLKRDRQPVEKTLQEIKPDYRGILRRQAERERDDGGDRGR